MNKFITKLAKIFLGLSMAAGVGVAIGTGRKDASPVHAASSTAYSYTFTSKQFSDNSTAKTLASTSPSLSVTWTPTTSWSVGSGYWGYDTTKGQQWGSGSHTLNTMTITSSVSFTNVTDVIVNASIASSGGCKLTTKVGSTAIGSERTLTTSATDYTQSNASGLTGTVSITLSNGSKKKAQYIKSITIKTKDSSDYVGSLSVSPSTWTGYDSQTLSVSSFTVSGSKNGTAGAVTSSDYEYKGIGYMSSGNFVARDATFSSGNPTTADTRLAWKAKYPTTSGGSTYAWAYVTLSVTADSVQSLAITGSMTNTTYTQGDDWDPTGFTVNAYYASAPSNPVNVTSNANLSWSYSPATTASTSTTSVTCTASFGGKSASSEAQTVTVNEKQNLGGIVDGEKYFVIAAWNGVEYYLKSFENSSSSGTSGTALLWPGDNSVPTEDTNAWTFTSAGSDDTWTITNNNSKVLYSYSNSENNGLRCGTSSHTWEVQKIDNKLYLHNTAYSGTDKGQYFTLYGTASTTNADNFRTYSTTSAQNNSGGTPSVVRFVKYVAPASITSVEFTGDMTKKEYYVGDSWDYSGIKLQANKSDLSHEDLGSISALITAGDLEIEASPSAPALNVTSVTITGVYGENLLDAEITITNITVSTPRSITAVAITGDMTNKSYTAGDPWNYAGLNMTVTYDQGQPDVVALTTAVSGGDISFTPNPASATVGTTTLTLGSISHTSFVGQIADKVITGITVTAVPGRINFGTTTGYWNPAQSGATTTDNLGNTVEITSNSGAAYTQQGTDYKQVGTNNNAASEVTITITLQEKSGIDALSIKYSGAATRSNHTVAVYGDSVDDVILSGSISGSTEHEQSTDQNYKKINATSITVKFTANVADCGGIKIFYISYTLGSQVQEFGTLSSIAVSSSSMHNTLFEVDHTFSTEGLVITATDTVGFTKDFTTGFTTNYDGVTFDDTAEDVEVTVTMTIGGVTKTTSYYIDVIEIPSFTLASSQNDLYEGMTVLIAYVNGDNVYTAGSLAGSYLNKIDGSKDGDDIRAGEGSYEFVVEYYGSNILLRHGANYIKHSGDKSITFTTTIDEACVWSYDGSALQNVSHDTYYLQYNSGSPRFTDYTGSQHDVGLYISSATPISDLMGATTFAQKYLHMRDYLVSAGSCSDDSENHYYSTAKTEYSKLTTGEKTEFAGLSEAVARLQAWARANGETFDPSAKTFSANPRVSLLNVMGENTNTVAIIVIISMVSVTAIGGYFFLRKRKENI